MNRLFVFGCLVVASILLMPVRGSETVNVTTYQLSEEPAEEDWILLADDVTATVYNALPSQCNADYLHTASMFKIEKKKVHELRIIAMERTMMAEYGLKYGDVLMIEGADDYDGYWRLEDTMNIRFAGQHKIDFLVGDNVKTGKWENVKIFKNRI